MRIFNKKKDIKKKLGKEYVYNYLIKKYFIYVIWGGFFNLLVMCYFKNIKDLYF